MYDVSNDSILYLDMPPLSGYISEAVSQPWARKIENRQGGWTMYFKQEATKPV